jgi:hypothetical protein
VIRNADVSRQTNVTAPHGVNRVRNAQRFTGAVLFFIVIMGTSAWPQDGAGGRDPFFPSETRPAAPVPASRESAWGRDPFVAPGGGARTAPTKRPAARARGSGLTGIIYGEQTRLAVVDGEVLRVGGRVGDKRITDIRRRSVVLIDPAGRHDELFLEDFSAGK